MNEEIIKHAEAISEILRKEYNPHVRVEVEAHGLRVVSDDGFQPIMTDEPKTPSAVLDSVTTFFSNETI